MLPKSLNPLQKNAVSVSGKLDALETLMFIPGFGTDQTAWQSVANAFADDYRLVLFDNAGTGHAAPEAFIQSKYLNLTTYADDVFDICKALELPKVILVGHSIGGMIAILAAIKQPVLVEKLIVIGASPRYLNDIDYYGGFSEKDLSEVYGAISMDFYNWLDQFSKQVMNNPLKPSLARRFAESIRAIPQDQILTTLCAIFQSDHRAEVEKLSQPTLIIQAKEDAFVPLEVAGYLHAHTPNSQLKVINACGHLPHISAPLEVIAAIRSFLYLQNAQ